jgi:hypothetical protein
MQSTPVTPEGLTFNPFTATAFLEACASRCPGIDWYVPCYCLNAYPPSCQNESQVISGSRHRIIAEPLVGTNRPKVPLELIELLASRYLPKS